MSGETSPDGMISLIDPFGFPAIGISNPFFTLIWTIAILLFAKIPEDQRKVIQQETLLDKSNIFKQLIARKGIALLWRKKRNKGILMGDFHPIFVHFPIVLFALGLVCDLLNG